MHHGQISKPVADGLIALRSRIEKGGIPSSKLDETLNLATWNIREFGKKARSEAAIHYIAEILGQFNLIGVVELRDNLADLDKVLHILGPYWRAVYSDMISDPGGNRDRIALRLRQARGHVHRLRHDRHHHHAANQEGHRVPAGSLLVAASLCRLLSGRQLRFRRHHNPHPLGRQPQGTP